MEDFELKGKEGACKLNIPSNKHTFEDNFFITAVPLIPLTESPRQKTTFVLKPPL